MSHIAIDLGATSGRIIVADINNGKLSTNVTKRFPHHLIHYGKHSYWDIFALYHEIISGLRDIAKQGVKADSIGIDTWGVDFVCLAEKHIISTPRSYRDLATFNSMEDYLKNVMSRKELYDITGIQIINLNTIFQLHAMRLEDDFALRHAEKILFMPDALSWMLTGESVCEFTIASTSQLLNAKDRKFDQRVLKTLGLREEQFGRMVEPGTIIGRLTEEVQQLTGLSDVPVVAVAGHDTASAVAAVPARNEQFAYLSSGTWSLMGVEAPHAIVSDESYERNITNEGGIEGTTRFLKNICGMWLYEQCRNEWPDEVRALGHADLMKMAAGEEAFRSIINPDDDSFAAPKSMTEAIRNYCIKTHQPTPETPAQYCRCIFDSLALRYRQVFEWLKELAPFPVDTLHIIGGGSLNGYLNQATANATGAIVLAGPQECTALGNIMMQAYALGVVSNRWEMRRLIADNVEPVKYEPKDKAVWDKAFERFLEIIEK